MAIVHSGPPMRPSTTEDTDMTMSTVMEAMGVWGSRRQDPGHCHSLGYVSPLGMGQRRLMLYCWETPHLLTPDSPSPGTGSPRC